MLPYFKILPTSDLELIVAEIQEALPKIDPRLQSIIDANVVRYDSLIDIYDGNGLGQLQKLYSYLPLTVKFLLDRNIDPMTSIAVVRIVIPAHSEMFIHIDGSPATKDTVSPKQGFMGQAINIPILNCEKSYTAWYDAEPYLLSAEDAAALLGPGHCEKYGKSTHNSQMRSLQNGFAFKKETAKEVARAELKEIMYYNLTVPHCGFNTGDFTRVLLSLRFSKHIDIGSL